MYTHQEVFLSLVRNSLWDTSVDVPEQFKNWNLVMQLAEEQAMQGAVAKSLLDSPLILKNLKSSVRTRLRNLLMTNVVMHSIANSTIQFLVLTLRKAGIECVLLKGQGLAFNYKYPDIRECGDIDLYVRSDDYNNAYITLKDIVDEIDDSSVLSHSNKHFHAKLSGISIEVHRYSEVMSSSSLNRIYQHYATDGLTNNLIIIDFDDVEIFTPADNFNAFYIFSHLWNHFLYAGVGLRQLTDWTMFLHSKHNKLDNDYLCKVLTELNLMLPWKTFGCIVVDYLGLPSDEFPFYDSIYRQKALKILNQVMVAGDLGRETEFIRIPTKGYLSEKLYSLNFYIKHFMDLVNIFPNHAINNLFYSIKGGLYRL